MRDRTGTAILAVLISICLFGCGASDDFKRRGTYDRPSEATGETVFQVTEEDAGDKASDKTGADLSGTAETETKAEDRANRASKDSETSDDGDLTPPEWTIYVYLCGSDLESADGVGTNDIKEMAEGSLGGRVRFVVETGGTREWKNDFVDPTKNQRFLIERGKVTIIGEKPRSGMNRYETLMDFLSFCKDNYRSDHTGFVFWNHGGGSITGVCFDQNNSLKSLSLKDIQRSFSGSGYGDSDKYDFIGFDACIMATVETACILKDYGKYMFSSQENESEEGWDYLEIGKKIRENPSVSAVDLGKHIADVYYKECIETGEEDTATFSVLDLSDIDVLTAEFNVYSKELYDATEDQLILADVARAIGDVDNFGGNNRSEGYTNMVDLAGIIRAGQDVTKHSETVLSALDRCVLYKKNGIGHERACGLSAYYPLVIGGTRELAIFGQVAVSPYYLAFVDRAAYSGAKSGSTEGYDPDDIFPLWGQDYESLSSHFSYYDYEFQVTGESPYVEFSHGPAFDADGYYSFGLTESSAENILNVTGTVYEFSEDSEDIICLGETAEVYQDWDRGEFSDDFDGYWFSLPDGQNLSVYLQTQTEDADIYSSPVELNGKRTNLVIIHDIVEGYAYIAGVRYNVGDSGMSERTDAKLKTGDRILPLYEASSVMEDKEYEYCGNEYLYREGDMITFEVMPDGKYLFGFIISDLYGDYYVTDFTEYEVKGEEVYYTRQ
ncbi:MAG: hypothetical protein K6E33_05435 [Lachnospiraceae bacterium]|nr:hypothetical protein [Lachnospiraceae bacterium]